MDYSQIGLIIIGVLLVLILWKLFTPQSDKEAQAEMELLKDKITQLNGAVMALLDTNRNSANDLKAELNRDMTSLRTSVTEHLAQTGREILETNRNSATDLKTDLNRDITTLRTVVTENLTQTGREMRETLVQRLNEIQKNNAEKLEEMRKTVDEKLHATLEQRLGESFKQVSAQLEQVHRGLGEMQTLATGVGDLRRVLTNVKSRGTWGEVQLGALIEQTLTKDQYQKNISTKPGSADLVEFAIKLPGRDVDAPVWLPIDAKFPIEDYLRLSDAQDRVDIVEIESAGKALETRIKLEAKKIREKYIEPPHTTDFAILFLPTEGLYAEIIRRNGLIEFLQNEYRVSVAGPSTFSAMLNSLQMGFKTLAIEERSSEIWKTLSKVKTEFGKFGEVIDATKKKLEAASKQFDSVDTRTRQINKALKGVEVLSTPDGQLIGLDLEDDTDSES